MIYSDRIRETLCNSKKGMIFEFNGTPLRENPYEGSRAIGFLDMYARVTIYDKVGKYYFVAYHGTFGYIPVTSVIIEVEEG